MNVLRRELILERSIPEPNTGCWLWLGGTNQKGYGKFSVERERFMAHRAAYILYIGPIESGLLVCHRCDTPSCVNPDHLFLGTDKENAEDREAKKRGRWKNRIVFYGPFRRTCYCGCGATLDTRKRYTDECRKRVRREHFQRMEKNRR